MLRRLVTLLMLVAFASAILPARAQQSTTPIYKDPSRPVADRVNDLLSQMTLDEKIGQMTLVEKNSVKQADIAGLGIGGVLSGGGGDPVPHKPEAQGTMGD